MTMFFMLSGFILSYRYSAFTTVDDTHRYIAARIARLYPVYFFMGVTTLWRLGEGAGQFYLIQRFGYLGAIPFAIFAIFLFVFALQAWIPSLFSIWNFGGSWSLSVEAFFYTLFPWLRKEIGRLSDRLLCIATFALPAAICLITLGLLVSYSEANNTSIIFYVLPIFRLPEFLFGICGYILFVERRLYRKALRICGVVFCVVLINGIFWRDLPGYIDWGALAAFTFMATFVNCIDWNAPSPIKKIVNYLGRISYCVYIAQFTTIPILKKFKASLSLEQEWALVIASTIMFAILTYHFVEVLAYTKTKKLTINGCQLIWLSLQRYKMPNKTVNSSATHVTPPAKEEPRDL